MQGESKISYVFLFFGEKLTFFLLIICFNFSFCISITYKNCLINPFEACIHFVDTAFLLLVFYLNTCIQKFYLLIKIHEIFILK